MLPKRPEKRVKTGLVLSVVVLLQLALAPASKSSAKTWVAPLRTTTLSMPQLSLLRSSSPPSVKRMLALPSGCAVKDTLTWR